MMLDQIGSARLLQGVSIFLTATCAVVLASPILREIGALESFRISFRLTGTFTDPSDAGPWSLAWRSFLQWPLLTNGGSRKLGYLGLITGIAATLSTATRSSFLVLVAILVLFALCNLRYRRQAAALALGATGLVALAVVVIQITPWVQLRLLSGPGTARKKTRQQFIVYRTRHPTVLSCWQ